MPQQQARQQIQTLINTYKGLSQQDRLLLTEANVIHQFINPLLSALGWPIHQPQRFKYELSTQAGRPDMTLIPAQGGTIFVEAKRFGVIAELEQSRKSIAGIVTPGQLSLPGMATDRTAEEQQAINYAFSNGGTWAILTNFERLRLFNARRDWLVLSFENPNAYLDEFDLLWQLSYESILNGRLEQLSNQRHREDVDSDYLNFINQWRERLAQDILHNRIANWWAFDENGLLNLPQLRAVVQQILDRLVVVRFAEDHLIAPANTLAQIADLARNNPYTFNLTQSFQQLFRRFDDLHNSALFAPSLADQAVFSDGVLDGLVSKLYEARYRAMTADIMGNTYEQYLGKALVLRDNHLQTADNLETRKKQGSYYTPQVIVRYLVDNSLGRYLYGTADGQPDGEPLEGESRKTAADIQHLRLIDPACGSGGFLIYAYQVLADFYRGEIARLEREAEQKRQELVAQGMTTPLYLQIELTPYTSEIERLQHYPRLILENHLYGVDLDPQAAEIATVNLIMRAMADQQRGHKRLPLILNQNIKVGNALIGAAPHDPRISDHLDKLYELRHLRRQLVQHGQQHDNILNRIEQLTAELNAIFDNDLDDHFDDLEAVRPLHWPVAFPEVFLPASQTSEILETSKVSPNDTGFNIVTGNPPWEIVKPDLREYYAQFDPDIESKLTRKRAEARIAQLAAGDPALAEGWQAQKARVEAAAAYYKSSPDFSRQGRGDTATHKLFLERGYDLLRHEGRLGFVVPSGLYTDLGTKELRQMLLNEGRIEYLYNFSNERFFFPSVDHRVKFTLLGAQKGQESDGFWATFRFNPRVAVSPDELASFLLDPDNLVYVRRKSVQQFSPDSLSVMEFPTQADYDITEKIFENFPLLGEQLDSTWNVKLNNEFHMTNDRHLFNTNEGVIAVYNGRMIHQFDAYYAPHEFWIAQSQLLELRQDRYEQIQHYRLGYRRIARTTDSRTLIAAVIPPNTICDTVALIENGDSIATSLYLCAVFNSLCLDYVLRQKIATTVNMFYMYQLPVPRLTADHPTFRAIVPRAAQLTCTTPAFADLWQQVMGTAWDENRAATDPATRQRLRSELDALIAHLYRLSRSDFAHILSTFPLVFPNTPAGEAKKESLLAVYDQFAPT